MRITPPLQVQPGTIREVGSRGRDDLKRRFTTERLDLVSSVEKPARKPWAWMPWPASKSANFEYRKFERPFNEGESQKRDRSVYYN